MTETAEADRFQRGVNHSALTSAVSVFVGFGGAVAVSRRFGSAIFGEYITVAAPLALLTLLSSFQEQVGFMHVGSKLTSERARFSALALRTYRFSETLTVLAMVVVLGGSWMFLNGPADKPDLVLPTTILLVGYAVMGNLAWNLDGVLTSVRASGPLSVARTVEAILQPALPLLLSVWWLNLWAFVAGTLLTYAVSAAIRVALVRKHISVRCGHDAWADSRADFRDVRAIGLQLYPGAMAGGLLDQTAIWIIRAVAGGSVRGDQVVGSFGRATNLTWRFQELTYRVSALLLPSLSETWANKDREGFRATARIAVIGYLAPLSALAAVLAGCSPNVLRLFGADFVDGSSALRYLLFASLLVAVNIVAGMVLIAIGKAGLLTRTSILGAAVMLVTIYPLTRQWGAGGAAASVLIGQAFGTVWRLPMLSKAIDGGIVALMPDHALRLIVPAIVGGVISFALSKGDSSIVGGLVAGTTAVGGCAITWVALGLGNPFKRGAAGR